MANPTQQSSPASALPMLVKELNISLSMMSSYQSQAAHADRRGYVIDNVVPPYKDEKRVVFLAILAVARMVIWVTRNKGLYEGANFSHRDLILYFRHQLRVKIRCDRKRLNRITFDKMWVNAASLVVRMGATLESYLPPLPAHGDEGLGPSGPHPG